nr:hypothetical protein [Tanacetum cinerariifolium]
MASIGSSLFWNTGTTRPVSGWENQIIDELMEHIPLEEWMMTDCKHCGERVIENHLMDRMMRLVVEIEYVGKSVDVFDKATWSFDGLQPEQVDLKYVHALKEPHLHDIRVVPNKHEVDQDLSCVDPLLI